MCALLGGKEQGSQHLVPVDLFTRVGVAKQHTLVTSTTNIHLEAGNVIPRYWQVHTTLEGAMGESTPCLSPTFWWFAG